jgi:hypothetical protein
MPGIHDAARLVAVEIKFPYRPWVVLRFPAGEQQALAVVANMGITGRAESVGKQAHAAAGLHQDNPGFVEERRGDQVAGGAFGWPGDHHRNLREHDRLIDRAPESTGDPARQQEESRESPGTLKTPGCA